MAHLLRGKQAGIQGDFSSGLGPELFKVDDINRYGINSQVSAIAYEPVQSLLALGTNDTKFGEGQIYVFGHSRIGVVFPLQRRASVKALQFCADKLLCLDTKNDLSVFSLETKRLVSSYSPPGTVLVLCTDPSLDYAFLGLQSGDVVAYDLDRGALAPLRIPSLWKERNPRARLTPVMALALHPRDVGSLLIGYAEGAVLYSFKLNCPTRFFQYEVPRGAPGGNIDPTASNVVRHPPLTQAIWHPTGTFILTGHDDGSLVFWDAKDGRVVMARTLTDANIDKIGSQPMRMSSNTGNMAVREPLFKIVWCANQDPEDTAILVAGGASQSSPEKGMTLLELGRTPNYATSSWQILSQYLESPKRQRLLPTPPNTEVVDVCMIPRSSPHFAGAQDPIALIALLSSGEVITMSFPSGFPISPTNQLHISLTFVHPFVTAMNLSPIERSKWLGMTERRSMGPPILSGGAEANRPMKRYENRNIVQTAHVDGSVRLWDAGHGDEIENESVLQVDVDRAVGRPDGIEIVKMSFSGASGEFAAGTKNGEVAIFRWGHNRIAGREPPDPGPNSPKALTDISSRTDPTLTDGLLPLTLLDMKDGPVTALKVSDVGFVAVGFERGSFAVIDLRGPSLIFQGHVRDLAGQEKRGTFRRHSAQPQSKNDWLTTAEFSVMTLDGDSYSSILLHIGTSAGHLATYKILPESGGRYAVQFAGTTTLDEGVVRIEPIHAESGHPISATQQAVAGLRNGIKTNGILVVATRTGLRIFKPMGSKGASKSLDNTICRSAAVARFEDRGFALLILCDDGSARAYSIPGLREIASVRVSNTLEQKRFSDAVITHSGDVYGWTGPSETALINLWGNGLTLNRSKDTLFNPELIIPPRPTISNVQWISGTQYITPADLDLLIGGSDRPPSKRMLEQNRQDGIQARQLNRAGSSSAAGQEDEGYWAYMQRQINERTEKLGIVGDSVNKLEEQSATWADDVGKFVERQKRNMVMGAVKGKFGI